MPESDVEQPTRSPLFDEATTRALWASARLFLESAVLGALVWFWWWNPATGFVVGGEFYWRPTNIEGAITGTAKYLIVATVIGLAVGLWTSWRLADKPWFALGACGGFGALAGWVMAFLGHLLGPEDADAVAARSVDGTRVLADLALEGVGPYATLPAAALLAATAFFLLTGRREATGD